ncbi:glycosyltransferase 87 family protein [Spirillospora sp. NPDC029432]|uniref:glycosyltransferase 87 family protein n=1 Tax=Spirillospora sp. NPDC029432 TaxID=3154599 RepID=UPI0034556217
MLPSPARAAVPRPWPRLFPIPALYAACAVFAAATAAVTALAPHRTWGTIAAAAYGLGALAALHPRGRERPAAVAGAVLAGAVPLPLAVLAALGQAQPEVDVVHRSAAHLLEHGTPYLGPAEAAAHGGYEAFNPYLPGMALLGLPHALAGVDARLVFGALFVALLVASSARRDLRLPLLPLLFIAASPLVALPLTVGGDDLPVIGLACLGLALAVRDRPAAAGLVMGVAATLKATAWPALIVCLVLIAARRHRTREARMAPVPAACARAPWSAFAMVAGGVVAAGVLVPALIDPQGFLLNVVRFPLGLAGVDSPAASPLPGRLLADLGAYGHAAALALLGLAALGMAVSLAVRPPRDARSAALRLSLGLLLAMALMPATRWGYLVYPAVLALWAHLAAPVPAPAQKQEEELCLVA